MAVTGCRFNSEIPRIPASDLSEEDFNLNYFKQAKPVIITGATTEWPAIRSWTISSLMEKVGNNEVLIRGKVNKDEYRSGKAYTIRKDTFYNYCSDILSDNARAKSSYLAVASLQQAFPQLLDDVPLPKYLKRNGKLHLGPYMWVAIKHHYEFCHYDPDDNFLVMVQGRKQVRLFGYGHLQSLYPNPLGSHGKTIQSQVDLDKVDAQRFPLFVNDASLHCQHCVLHPGEMLFIPAFYWHQVTALDTGISVNMFYGDSGENNFIDKILNPPYFEHYKYWFHNIIQQNIKCGSFQRILGRLPEVLIHFFLKQWHEVPLEKHVNQCIQMVLLYCELKGLPKIEDSSKFPPILKIRGLTHRNGTEAFK